MGQAWSELSSMSARKEENQKETFYEELRQFARGLVSFEKIERFSTTDYRHQYATIILNKMSSGVKDDQLKIEQYLNENKRDNWDVSVKLTN